MRARHIVLALVAVALVATPAAARPAITATPALFPKFRPGVTDYVSRCRLGHPLRIEVRGRIRRHRLREGQAIRVRTGGRTYHVRCLPKHFPKWKAERHGQPEAEWYLVTP